MTITVEILNEKTLGLLRELEAMNLLRLFMPSSVNGVKKAAKSVEKSEREKAIERIRNFKASGPSSFGDALEWQIREREDRPLPFDEIR